MSESSSRARNIKLVQCQGDGKMCTGSFPPWTGDLSQGESERKVARFDMAQAPVRERGNAAARMEGSGAIFSAAPHVVSSALRRGKCVGSRYAQWDSIGVIFTAEYFPLKA